MATYIACFLVVSLLVPSSISQCTTEKALPFFRRSVYEFSLELVSRVAQESENHFVTSALSPWTLISALSLGAADETLQEIKQVLRLHPHKCFNAKFFELIQEITEANEHTTLERSSTIFADNRLPLNDAFINKVRDSRISDMDTVTVEDLSVFAAHINDYVRTATHNAIDEIVEASDLEQVYMVLIDALYFEGTWRQQFSGEDTEVSAFYNDIGNQIGDVNLMFAEIEANYTNVEQIGATILELPYGNNGRFSMLFILPNEGQTIPTVLDKLKRVTLSSIFVLFQQSGSQHVMVQIPRFKINSDLDNMKEWLMDMGLSCMFDGNRASFPEISDYKMFVSNFIQKAVIEVNEQGTEASVVSGAFLQGRSLARVAQFTANKPFLFMIVDRKLELPVFMGAYSKPTVY